MGKSKKTSIFYKEIDMEKGKTAELEKIKTELTIWSKEQVKLLEKEEKQILERKIQLQNVFNKITSLIKDVSLSDTLSESSEIEKERKINQLKEDLEKEKAKLTPIKEKPKEEKPLIVKPKKENKTGNYYDKETIEKYKNENEEENIYYIPLLLVVGGIVATFLLTLWLT